MHAEAYSSAEVLHGPVALVGPAFPVIALAARDAAEASVTGMADSQERIARSRDRERQYEMLTRTGKISDYLR